MKYILPFLMISLLFMGNCGGNKKDTGNETRKANKANSPELLVGGIYSVEHNVSEMFPDNKVLNYALLKIILLESDTLCFRIFKNRFAKQVDSIDCGLDFSTNEIPNFGDNLLVEIAHICKLSQLYDADLYKNMKLLCRSDISDYDREKIKGLKELEKE